ncbi:MAG: glycosyltransferase [bacterium]
MTSKRPKVSVIIPTYNQAGYLCEAIESVLCQTYNDYELVVIDDGSYDNTKEAVSSYSSAKIRYFYQKNNGLPSALNLALDKSRGEYIARLDHDDLYLTEKLEKQVSLLDSNPNIGLVYTQAYTIDEKGNIDGLYLKNHTCPPEPLRILRHFLFPPTQSIMFRRTCLDKVSYFDKNMPIANDWDFCIRMVQHYKFAYIEKPLVKIRRHSGATTTLNKKKAALDIIQVMQKHLKILSMGESKAWISPHYYNLGRIYFYERDYKNAKKNFLLALKYNPYALKNLFFFALGSFPPSLIGRIRTIKSALFLYKAGIKN